MILEILVQYFPGWKLPKNPNLDGWTKVHCPNPDHQDTNPSASVNVSENRIRCLACGFGGDVYDIIQEQEECGFREAKRIAGELAPDLSGQVPRGSPGKSGRGTSSGSRFGPRGDQPVPDRFRRRA